MFPSYLLKLMVSASMLLGAGSAFAENRLALVIGQSAYRSVPALPNPANDARAVTQMLTDSGFEVSTASDLSQNEMRQQVSEFAGKVAAKGADTVALVFYAGHGLQIDGENYLVPVDVDPKREADIPIQAVRLNDILNTLTSVPSKMRILMLDACRNNPFPDISKTSGGGLAIVDAKIGAPGTFLSFSTSPERRRGRRLRRQQPVYQRAAQRRQGVRDSDRGNLQAGAVGGEQGDRRPADPVGQLFADRRFPVPGPGGCRSEARGHQEERCRVDARPQGQAGRGGQRGHRGRRHR